MRMLWLRALAAFGRRPRATPYEPIPLYVSAVPVIGSAPSVASVRASYLPTLQTDVEELHQQLRDAVAEVHTQSMVLAELVASVRAQEFVLQNVLATVQHERAIGQISEATLDLAAIEARRTRTIDLPASAEFSEGSGQHELVAAPGAPATGAKVSLERPSRVSLVKAPKPRATPRVSLEKAAPVRVSLEKAAPAPRVSLVKPAKAEPAVSLVKLGKHAAPVRVSLEKASPVAASTPSTPVAEDIWVSMTLPVVSAAEADAMGTLSEISSARPATAPEPVTVDLRKESQVA